MSDFHFDRAVRIIKDCADQPPEVTARALQLAALLPPPTANQPNTKEVTNHDGSNANN